MKKIILAACCLPFLTSCVTRKLYNELDAKYKNCAEELERLTGETADLKTQSFDLGTKNQSLQNQLEEAVAERDRLKVTYEQLQKDYNSLEKNSDQAIKAEIERLNNLKKELDTKSSRVAELEGKLAAQDKNLRKLKETLSKALFEFEGKGLTVEQKNGKVYVSMENKLLFPSGSWTVSNEGRNAVEQLAEVLAKNPDISILIEGHTDNDKIVGNLGGGVTNNWDLSTKRATAIVNIIEQTSGIDKKNLTAAGRSEYAPIATNSSVEGKSKNRRIEVILTPKLDEISKLLNEL
ncbi:OmpA family protein [Flavobacterium sp. CBA20B-1]|uniref:OmpA/MotB family protein n=1 Tax=unclassified Flavobacterium TaxID=196869 RepID=UPI002224591A|nr:MULTISPECIES: OmpA family protein [unclassified Flavobacterium]WCM41010.1 OmpA family protein [Flavobacterium sp. CBA20B-1]